MTTATKTPEAKAEAKIMKWLRAGMLDARCALPTDLANAVERLATRGEIVKVPGGTFGYWKAATP